MSKIIKQDKQDDQEKESLPFVIRDVQEKKNYWNFIKSSTFAGTKREQLLTGDYTLSTLRDVFAIERKATTGELAGNLTTKQFENELKRAMEFKHFYIICAFSVADILNFPRNSGIPPKFWKRLRVSSKYMLKRIVELETTYNCSFIFAGDNDSAKEYAKTIFKRMMEMYSDEADGTGK